MFADRVQQTTSTVGTGTANLDGAAAAGFVGFIAAFGSGAEVAYLEQDSTGANWELGYGTVTSGSPDTLTRNAIRSSNSNNLVSFAAGTKTVSCVTSTDFERFLLNGGQLPTSGGTATAITATFAPGVRVLRNGMTFWVKMNANAAGGGTTFTPDAGLTALSALKGNTPSAIAKNDWFAGDIVGFMYDSAGGGRYRVITPLALGATTGPWTDVASATTTDIGASNTRNIRITGTTTITGLGTSEDGVRRTLRFAGILTFTHNATSLILPTAANITTAANDTAELVSLGGGNWICVAYNRASGQPLAGGYVGANNLAQFQHTTTGTTSGGTATSGSWQTRTLNTTSINNIASASLSSNQISLPAGSYFVQIQGVCSATNSHMMRLRNVSDGADVAFTNYGRAQAGSADNNLVVGQNYFTIASTKLFELQYYCETTVSTTGLGNAVTNFGTNNIWAQVVLRKEA